MRWAKFFAMRYWGEIIGMHNIYTPENFTKFAKKKYFRNFCDAKPVITNSSSRNRLTCGKRRIVPAAQQKSRQYIFPPTTVCPTGLVHFYIVTFPYINGQNFLDTQYSVDSTSCYIICVDVLA